MALLQTQIDLINALVDDLTLTESQGRGLLSATMGFSDAQIAIITGLGLSSTDEDILLAEDRSTQETVENEIAEAKKALDDEDFPRCRRFILRAEMTVAAMPDYEFGDRKIQYRNGLARLAASLKEYEAHLPVDSTSSRRLHRRIAGRYSRS